MVVSGTVLETIQSARRISRSTGHPPVSLAFQASPAESSKVYNAKFNDFFIRCSVFADNIEILLANINCVDKVSDLCKLPWIQYFVDNLYSTYIQQGESAKGVQGDGDIEVIQDGATSFVVLTAIYFPSVTGAHSGVGGRYSFPLRLY